MQKFTFRISEYGNPGIYFDMTVETLISGADDAWAEDLANWVAANPPAQYSGWATPLTVTQVLVTDDPRQIVP